MSYNFLSSVELVFLNGLLEKILCLLLGVLPRTFLVPYYHDLFMFKEWPKGNCQCYSFLLNTGQLFLQIVLFLLMLSSIEGIKSARVLQLQGIQNSLLQFRLLQLRLSISMLCSFCSFLCKSCSTCCIASTDAPPPKGFLYKTLPQAGPPRVQLYLSWGTNLLVLLTSTLSLCFSSFSLWTKYNPYHVI